MTVWSFIASEGHRKDQSAFHLVLNFFSFFALIVVDVSNFINEKLLLPLVGENCFFFLQSLLTLLWSIFLEQCQLWNVIYFRFWNYDLLEALWWCLPVHWMPLLGLWVVSWVDPGWLLMEDVQALWIWSTDRLYLRTIQKGSVYLGSDVTNKHGY